MQVNLMYDLYYPFNWLDDFYQPFHSLTEISTCYYFDYRC